MNTINSIIAVLLMSTAIYCVACNLYKKSIKNEANELVELTEQAIKSHEDIEIDIKSTAQKK